MSDTLDLAALIRAGDTIAWSGAAAEPVTLMQRLSEALDRIPACTGFASVALTQALDASRLNGRMRVKALGGTGTNRRFADVGALDVLPAHYGSLPDLVAGGYIRIDVVLTSLAADGAGLNAGPQVDYLADALPRARVVVAEINDQAPVTSGDTAVDATHVDHLIRTSRPLPEMRAKPATGIEVAIGAHVARLVADGATLEAGIGALPDAVLECLGGKADLGVHSGTIGDRVVELIEAGVITNRRKPIDTGLTITAGLLGTATTLSLRASQSDAASALTPLHARYCHPRADPEPDRHQYRARGGSHRPDQRRGRGQPAPRHGRGHADFMRGCLRSQGGRGIVVMEATARGGTLSRIVAELAGGVVTTSRSDADIVVTEYGIAELRGRSLSERATALIAIAHPDFRRDLTVAAERLV